MMKHVVMDSLRYINVFNNVYLNGVVVERWSSDINLLGNNNGRHLTTILIHLHFFTFSKHHPHPLNPSYSHLLIIYKLNY